MEDSYIMPSLTCSYAVTKTVYCSLLTHDNFQYFRRVATNHSVTCQSVVWLNCAKMAERIHVLFGVETWGP